MHSPTFLPGKSDKKIVVIPEPGLLQQFCQFYDARHAAGIVVGAVVDQSFRPAIQRIAVLPIAQVVAGALTVKI